MLPSLPNVCCGHFKTGLTFKETEKLEDAVESHTHTHSKKMIREFVIALQYGDWRAQAT